MISEGIKVSDFSLPNSEGKQISLSEFFGSKVVLYFYPKDDTPGCTTEACNFRDNFLDFSEFNAVILGISKDSVKSHHKFKEKYQLPFELLSDENLSVINQFGVWVEKSLYGRKYMGVERSTFLIDENGVLTKIFRNVKIKNHTTEVLKAMVK